MKAQKGRNTGRKVACPMVMAGMAVTAPAAPVTCAGEEPGLMKI